MTNQTPAWTREALDKIGEADELEIASLRQDGTLRKSRTIWVVRFGIDLYVRSVNGRGSEWFSGVLTRHQGRIEAGGVTQDVTFVEVDNSVLHEAIDDQYRKKYGHYPKEYVDACLTPKAHAATLKLVPRYEAG